MALQPVDQLSMRLWSTLLVALRHRDPQVLEMMAAELEATLPAVGPDETGAVQTALQMVKVAQTD